DLGELGDLPLARGALLPGGRLRDRGGRGRRQALADQRSELRPLQDVRHQGPAAEHRLGGAGGRRRPELPQHVSWMEKAMRLAALISVGLLAACAGAAERADAAQDGGMQLSASGAYLAGRHAQRQHDYGAAARFFSAALEESQGDFDLLNRTFRLHVGEGNWESAAELAPKVLETDPRDPVANLLLSLEAVRRGDFEAADRRATRLPAEGIHRLATPLVQAWIKLAFGRYDAAAGELAPLGDVRGLGPLRDLHWAAIADLAGDAKTASEKYEAVLKASPRLTWRAVDLAGNFYERTGRRDEARVLYRRFAAEAG